MSVSAIMVVPCYNEQDRLPLPAFATFLEAPGPYRLLFVNDGSRDATEAMLDAFCRAHSGASLLSLPSNRGKAEAVRHGMLEALTRQPDFVGYLDADLATPLSALPSFLEPFHAGPQLEIVLGSRVRLLGRNIERHTARHYLGRFFATVVSNLLRLPVYDTQCGAKLFRNTPRLQAILEEPFCTGWIFDVELLVRFLQSGGRAEDLYELPLMEWRDVPGSKIRHRDFLRAGLELARLIRRYRLLF